MLDIIRKPKKQVHINPRFRAYGKARIDIAQRAATRDDWDRLWKKSAYPFPFSWGKSWKQCIEYKVADFPAEVGFFIDILGFPVNAFDPDYAMFTSPNGDFFFSVVPVEKEAEVTPPDSIRLQFMVEEIIPTAVELERRGVKFDQWPGLSSPESTLSIGSFRTPNGISIDLWGLNLPEEEYEDEIEAALFEEEEDAEQVELDDDADADESDQVDPEDEDGGDVSGQVDPEDEISKDGSEVDQLELISHPNQSLPGGNPQDEEEIEEEESIEFDYFWEDST